ncbi:unnamed protein product [Ectocarpus sp. CCAP 1310/34]|nr:unnamed protein product [Ectocarpus sp. CCAP 1310/34]
MATAESTLVAYAPSSSDDDDPQHQRHPRHDAARLCGSSTSAMHKRNLSEWHQVAKDIALLQPSSAFMECVISILRACMDARQENSSFSDRVAASAQQRPGKIEIGEWGKEGVLGASWGVV